MTKVKKDTAPKEAKKNSPKIKDELPILRSGLTIRVHERIAEVDTKGKSKERVQIFEGIVIGVKKQRTPSGTFTVRKTSDGVGVEKIYPFRSPLLEKIEVVRQIKSRRARLNYLAGYKKRLKEKKIKS